MDYKFLPKPRVGETIPLPSYRRIKIGKGRRGDKIIYLILIEGRWHVLTKGDRRPPLTCFVEGSLLNGGKIKIKYVGNSYVKAQVVKPNMPT
jgi:hypothetical protein